MKKIHVIIFSIIIALFAFVANVLGQSKVETEVVFKFIQQKDGFFDKGNIDEINRLFGYVDKYKAKIGSGEIFLHVDGYCTSLSTEDENLQTAKTRSNRVKAELIVRKGLKENNFITRNFAQKYESESDVVVVILRIPGKVEEKPVARQEEKPVARQEEKPAVVEEKPKPEPKPETTVVAEPTPQPKPEPKPVTAIDKSGRIADSLRVHVAFRSVERDNLTGGISVIDIEDMMTKAYSLSSLSYLDATIGGVNGTNNIWGMGSGRLVVIDGIPRDDNNVLPSEIEQITILKGVAAVALYGSRAAKGVIQITTKRGKVEDLRVSIRANTGMHTPKAYPKYLGSAEYMTLYNEARVNDGLQNLYTPEDIYNYGSGLNPYRYPDLNFYSSEYLRKAYNRTEAMAEITGGSERARYYTTVGYYREGSILKVGNTKNDNISRMFIRGNVDLSLHELITAYVDANVTFYDSKSANTDFWSGAANFRPNRVAPLIPLSYIEANDEPSLAMLAASNYIIDGKYFLGGTLSDDNNRIADAYAAGDGKWISRQFQFNGGVNFNLKNVTNGLFFRGKYGVDYATTYNQRFTEEYATYTPTWTNYGGDDMIGGLTKNRDDKKTGNQNISDATYRTTTFFSGQFDYTKTLNDDHNIFAMLLANGWQRINSGVYHRISSANLGLQLSYNFRQKYYVDFTGAVLHSAKLPEGNRQGFSPTGTLGWRLTSEDFMKNQSIFDDLMLTVSGGIINSDMDITYDGNEYYLYRPVLINGPNLSGWWAWGDNNGEPATDFRRGLNPTLTFIKRKEINVGLRGSLLNKFITFDANYFNNRMDGGLTEARTIYPSYFIQNGYPASSIIPIVNFNIDDRQGIDYSVYFNPKAGDFSLLVGVSGMHLIDNTVRRDENYEFAYQTRMGRPLNQIWGLENLGFFEDKDDIAASPRQTWLAVKPGDIKYKDQNNDGVIDEKDEVYLGRWDSPTVLGLNLTVKWKRFSFFAMGTGYFGGNGMKNDNNNNSNNNYYWSGQHERKYSEIVRNRWTEETKYTATYPRLTTENSNNNFRSSDFWLYKSDRFNLSMLQFTYDVPESIFKSDAFKALSLYIGGYNLLVLSKERQHMEMNVGSAPQTRFYNFGLKATF